MTWPMAEEDWRPLLADILAVDLRQVSDGVEDTGFAGLGGSSLQAIEFSARMAQRHRRRIRVGELLGPRTVADVVSASLVVTEATSAPTDTPSAVDEPVTGVARVQQAMLTGEQMLGGAPFHLMFSAEATGPLDLERLGRVLDRLTRRHASLRTRFLFQDGGALGQQVLSTWPPTVLRQTVPAGTPDLIAAVHTGLAAAAPSLLRPFERPPVVFVVTEVAPHRSVITLLGHHALLDGWSIGLLWRELAHAYAEADLDSPVVPAPSMALQIADERSARTTHAATQRARQLADMPTTLTLPSDLVAPERRTGAGVRLDLELPAAVRRGCERLARECGVTRNAVVLAAWSLVIARRVGMSRFVLGMASAGRSSADALDVVGPCLKLLPVACVIDSTASVRDHVRSISAAARQALDAGDVPFEDVVAELGLGSTQRSGPPLAQVVFAAHDELVPDRLAAGRVTLRLREGHVGGTAYDAVLYVQRWGTTARLTLEYAATALRCDEAAELAAALLRALEDFASCPDRSLHEVRTVTDAQRGRLRVWGSGGVVDTQEGLWQLVEQVARQDPDAVAVRSSAPAQKVSYGELVAAAESLSAELASAGVGLDHRVGLAVGRGIGEAVAVLAVLRLGAAYVALDPEAPPSVRGAVLEVAQVRVVLVDDHEGALAQEVRADGRTVVPVIVRYGPGGDARACAARVRAAPPDPDRVAYLGFTSGSTGLPKGILVPHRGVIRLVRGAPCLLPGAARRFARLAPLAFDASTLEIFAPLVSGGTVEVYPDDYPTPDRVAQFLSQRRITGLWLTAGLFRVVADHRPDAFAGVVQVLTGGDVVPARQVAEVLARCPGIRVTNGYGPTENTTFTTVLHLDHAAEVIDPLPIGRPIPGTDVVILDAAGGLVPPGGVGELCAAGDGLALGYAGLPVETCRAFGRFAADDDRRWYRTGDLARWDAEGRVRFLGRIDHQVKIRGFRVEPDAVSRVLRDGPNVRDAAVVVTGSGADRRLLAGVVLTGGRAGLDDLRRYAAERLAPASVPPLWAVVAQLPVTRNGKLDAAALLEMARTGAGPVGRSRIEPVERPALRPDGDEVRGMVFQAWKDVLGSGPFGDDDHFFDVGGDSLQLLRLTAVMQRALPGRGVTVQDVFAFPTVRSLADQLRARDDR